MRRFVQFISAAAIVSVSLHAHAEDGLACLKLVNAQHLAEQAIASKKLKSLINDRLFDKSLEDLTFLGRTTDVSYQSFGVELHYRVGSGDRALPLYISVSRDKNDPQPYTVTLSANQPQRYKWLEDAAHKPGGGARDLVFFLEDSHTASGGYRAPSRRYDVAGLRSLIVQLVATAETAP